MPFVLVDETEAVEIEAGDGHVVAPARCEADEPVERALGGVPVLDAGERIDLAQRVHEPRSSGVAADAGPEFLSREGRAHEVVGPGAERGCRSTISPLADEHDR